MTTALRTKLLDPASGFLPTLESICQSPEAHDPIESLVEADDWLAVVTAEPGNPVVVFTQALASQNQLSVHFSRRLDNASMQWVDPPLLEVIPRSGGIAESDCDFTDADGGSSNDPRPMPRKKRARLAVRTRRILPEEVNQKSGVRDQLRSPDRLARPSATRLRTSVSTGGGGSFSIRSSNSPHVSAGR